MLQKIKTLLLKAVEYFRGAEASTESHEMDTGISLWEKMYEGKSPWEDGVNIVSMDLPKTICELVASLVLNEASIKVEGESERAQFLNKMLQAHVLPKLRRELEKGMAVGGFVMKPYLQDDQVMVAFCRQGEFRALAFDKDDTLIDVEFYDYYVEGKKTYSRVERQITQNEIVRTENKAFVSKGNGSSLGNEISLEATRWNDIEAEMEIENKSNSPLYGYYRVAKANNRDPYSYLGMSIFGSAVKSIEKCDRQFSRLDWEYEGGQMAIDAAEDVLSPAGFSPNPNQSQLDTTKQRLYRKIDLDSDSTYEVFNPSLRDANYLNGLDRYLGIVEDQVGLARGSLGYVVSEARTATEIKMLKQRTYDTVHDNQENLGVALTNLIIAMDYIASFYDLTPEGDYSITIGWDDSVLEDYQSQMDRELQWLDAGIKSKTEVRMFATGEDQETAQKAIDEIGSTVDLFGGLE